MLTYQDLSSVMLPALDAEWSDRYLPEEDIIPAINAAARRAVAAMGWAMANRKGAEESLIELTRVAIFQTNTQGAVSLADPLLGHDIWNVLAVYAEPETATVAGIDPSPNPDSSFRPDLSFAGSGKRVRRVTLEQVPVITNNMFMPGNEVIAGNAKLREYAYYLRGSIASSTYPSAGSELVLLPKSAASKVFVAVSYLKGPTEFTGANYTTASIEFPQMMRQTIADWSLEYIAYKQGDTATLKANAAQDAAQLFGFITN